MNKQSKAKYCKYICAYLAAKQNITTCSKVNTVRVYSTQRLFAHLHIIHLLG